MAPEPEQPVGPAALSRDRLVEAALQLLQDEGLDALTMRALGDRLNVKAASLYWHVHNRAELLELLAAALLQEASPPRAHVDWRSDALALCAALGHVTARRRDATRLLLEVPGALHRSQPYADLTSVLCSAGLSPAAASGTALMLLAAVLVSAPHAPAADASEAGRLLTLAVDSGTRGLSVRAGANIADVIHAAGDQTSPSTQIRDDRVIVRRLRGGRQGEVQLNPAHAWQFHVQAPTWNTLLDLVGLDVRGIHLDSGAARVEIVLPRPRGVVPIDISSGVIGMRVRRPPGVAIAADIHTGSVQLRLDGMVLNATASTTRWESYRGAAAAVDRYQLTIHSGTVRVALEEDTTLNSAASPSDAAALAHPRASMEDALNVALDGVAARALQTRTDD